MWSQEKEDELRALEADPRINSKASSGHSVGWNHDKEAELAALESELGGQKPQESQKTFDFSGEKVMNDLKEGGKAAFGALPFAQSAMDVAGGKNPYTMTSEGVARLGGDVGGTAAAVATGGIPAIAKFAGLTGALEATGVTPAFQKASQWVDKVIPDAVQGDMVFDPTSRKWRKSVIGGVAQNFILNTPQAALQTGIESAPAMLAGKMASGKVNALVKELPVNSETLRAAQERNIPVTQGALEGGKAALKEKQFAINPSTSGLAEEFYKRQNAAQKEALANEANPSRTALEVKEAPFNDPYLGQEMQTGEFNKARLLGDVKGRLKDVRSDLGAKVGEAKRGAYEALPIVAGIGKTFKDALAELGQKYNIPDDVAAMPKINRQGVSQAAAGIFKNVMDEAEQVKTLKQAQGILDTFDESIKTAYKQGQIANKNTPLFTEMRQRINGIMGEALKNVSPEAAAELQATKSKFSKIAGPTEQLYKDLSRSDPQEAFGKLINSQGKVGKVEALKAVFAESDPDFIKQFQARALQELALRSMTGEELSTAKLASQWNSNTGLFKDGLKEAIFTPEQIKTIDKQLAIQKMNMGPREAMGTQAKGGSQTQARMALEKAASSLRHAPGIGRIADLGGAIKGGMDKYAASKYFGQAAELPKPARTGFLSRQVPKGLMGALLTGRQAGNQQFKEAR